MTNLEASPGIESPSWDNHFDKETILPCWEDWVDQKKYFPEADTVKIDNDRWSQMSSEEFDQRDTLWY